MNRRGANVLVCMRPIASTTVAMVVVIAAMSCGGVHADGDGDSDADLDVDADGDVGGDADADVDRGPDDLDNDGVAFQFDCNDCNAGMGSGFPEQCGNGLDEDCADGDTPCDPDDADGDVVRAAPGGADCDDGDPQVFPGALGRCEDGVAQDCVADRPCGLDADGDHFAVEDDCDDTNLAVHPWADEVCDPDGIDEDCDGQVNELTMDADRFGCIFDPEEGVWQTVDYLSDPRHCGRCRNDCLATGAGTRCSRGTCE
jgi:hypothetical protein